MGLRNPPRLPMLKRYLEVVHVDEDTLQVRSANSVFVLRGKSVRELMTRLLPLLDGTHSHDQLVGKLPDVEPAVIEQALQALHEKALIEDAAQEPSRPMADEELAFYQDQITFFSHFSGITGPGLEKVEKFDFQLRLADAHVLVIGLGKAGAAAMANLAVSGVGHLRVLDDQVVTESDLGILFRKESLGQTRSDAAISAVESLNPFVECISTGAALDKEGLRAVLDGITFVVLSDETDNPQLIATVNELCQERKIPWTSLRMGEIEIQLGPTVIPGETPCWNCFDLRRKGNLTHYQEEMAFEQHRAQHRKVRTYGNLQAAASLAGSLAAIEAVKVLTNVTYPLSAGRMMSFNLVSMQFSVSNVMRLPRCSVCGHHRDRPATTPYAIFLN